MIIRAPGARIIKIQNEISEAIIFAGVLNFLRLKSYAMPDAAVGMPFHSPREIVSALRNSHISAAELHIGFFFILAQNAIANDGWHGEYKSARAFRVQRAARTTRRTA